MGLSNGKKRGNPDQTAYSLKLKIKDLPAPVFEVKKKGPGDKDFTAIEQTFTNISGNLVSIEVKETPYQGSVIQSVTAVLEDGNDVFFVNLPMNHVGRAILNRLFSIKSADQLENVEISVYQSKPKVEGGKTYAQGMVRQNDEPIKWKYENDSLPEVPKVKIRGKEVSDFGDMDHFFMTEAKKLSELVKSLRSRKSAPAQDDSDAAVEPESKKPAPTKKVESKTSKKEVAPQDDDGSEIPF